MLTEQDILSGRTIHVAMHDYEVDSLCSFIKLSYKYWKASDVTEIFEEEWLKTAKTIVSLWQLEQDHHNSNYTYPILDNQGKGIPVCHTGMTWSAMRPSDDACQFNYLIPANMFAVVTLNYLSEIVKTFYHDEADFLLQIARLKDEIDLGIH